MAQYNDDTYKTDSYKLYEAIAQVASDSHVPNITFCSVAFVAALGRLNLLKWDVKSPKCAELGRKANHFDDALRKTIEDSKVDITKAEFLCYDQHFQPSEDYKKLLKQEKIDLIPLNFDDPAKTAELINEIVKDRTKGTMLKAVTHHNIEESFLLTVSGIYMKALWDFPLRDKSKERFHTPEKEIDITMMKGTGKFRTKNIKIAGCAVTALELPLNGDALGFYILMTEDVTKLQTVEKHLHEIELEEVLKVSVQEMQVKMPDFIAETDLVSPLTTNHVDIGKTFTPAPGPQYKPKVTTGGKISVTPSGIICESVSAGANIPIDSQVTMQALQSLTMQRLSSITINRSFVFIVGVNRVPLKPGDPSVIPIFIGRCEDPTKEPLTVRLVVPLDDNVLE